MLILMLPDTIESAKRPLLVCHTDTETFKETRRVRIWVLRNRKFIREGTNIHHTTQYLFFNWSDF